MQSRHVPPPQSDAGEDVSGRIEVARAPMPPEPCLLYTSDAADE